MKKKELVRRLGAVEARALRPLVYRTLEIDFANRRFRTGGSRGPGVEGWTETRADIVVIPILDTEQPIISRDGWRA